NFPARPIQGGIPDWIAGLIGALGVKPSFVGMSAEDVLVEVVDEDPVTGSSHCVLTPFWAQRLGKVSMTAYQASARGGILRLRLDNDRVRISGRTVTVIRGELLA
ncbi:MAG TPA: PhzF family phenazine biosynthesis protein, partial [Terriglobales bacterium]|nr:PhzF family phenazine biosynthesis protein [Terriglobales bacterium]